MFSFPIFRFVSKTTVGCSRTSALSNYSTHSKVYEYHRDWSNIFLEASPSLAEEEEEEQEKQVVEKRWKNALKENTLSAIIRVNQAGEHGATRIYKGQIDALEGSDSDTQSSLEHMLAQEQHHYETFNRLLSEFRVRPSLLSPAWHIGGYLLGYVSGMLGKEAAMACTVGVETVIGEHYNDQMRQLMEATAHMEHTPQEIVQLIDVIQQFRDEELEHLDHAIEKDAEKMQFYDYFQKIIQTTTKIAVKIAKDV